MSSTRKGAAADVRFSAPNAPQRQNPEGRFHGTAKNAEATADPQTRGAKAGDGETDAQLCHGPVPVAGCYGGVGDVKSGQCLPFR